MIPVYLSKNLAVASSTSVATISSAGTVTLAGVTLATGRRIIQWGSSLSNVTYTITGLNEFGQTMTETVVGSTANGGTTSTKQDFISVTAASVSGTLNSTTTYFGTSTTGGTPWQAVDTTRTSVNVGFSLDLTSTSIIVSVETATEYPAFNTQTRLWQGGINTGPVPFISTAASSVAADTIGQLSSGAFACYRMTLTSSSSASGTVTGTFLQAG